MVILAICGSRSYHNYARLKQELLARYKTLADITEIRVGGKGTNYPGEPQRGAATLGKRLADELGIPCRVVEPDWKRFGGGAGPIHISQIIDPSDKVFAAWEGASPGTFGEIEYAKAKGKSLEVFRFDQDLL
jgi:hypothetical protein